MQKTELLLVMLTREEREERAAELSSNVEALKDMKRRHKDAKKDMKDAEDQLEAKVIDLARVHRSGKEHRQVEVARHADIDRALWCVMRLDTGEQVRTEPMTAHDLAEARQERLPGLQ